MYLMGCIFFQSPILETMLHIHPWNYLTECTVYLVWQLSYLFGARFPQRSGDASLRPLWMSSMSAEASSCARFPHLTTKFKEEYLLGWAHTKQTYDNYLKGDSRRALFINSSLSVGIDLFPHLRGSLLPHLKISPALLPQRRGLARAYLKFIICNPFLVMSHGDLPADGLLAGDFTTWRVGFAQADRNNSSDDEKQERRGAQLCRKIHH